MSTRTGLRRPWEAAEQGRGRSNSVCKMSSWPRGAFESKSPPCVPTLSSVEVGREKESVGLTALAEWTALAAWDASESDHAHAALQRACARRGSTRVDCRRLIRAWRNHERMTGWTALDATSAGLGVGVPLYVCVYAPEWRIGLYTGSRIRRFRVRDPLWSEGYPRRRF